MTALVRFSSELSSWLVQNLDRGAAPRALMDTMIAQRMEPGAARAIVEAFVAARREGRPVPLDAVSFDEEAPRIGGGPCIVAGDRRIRVLARGHRPTLAILADVLTAEECGELIAMAKPRLKPSTVLDPQSGRDVVAAYRSSLGMFFRPQENELIARLELRFAQLMNLPIENGEGLQVLYYPPDAGSAPHFDFLQASNAASQASIERSGQRVSTLVTYLNDVEQGGETVFPEAGWSVTPQLGHALYFEYCNSLGQVDPRSLHAASPVLRGEKWVASKWMRQRRFVPASAAAT
jgi:prolyl 4-hydroxylase